MSSPRVRPETLQQIGRLGVAGTVIADAARRGVDRDVPSCPGWTLADLIRHVGAVHRWAHEVISGRLTGRPRDMFALLDAAGAAAVAPDDLAAWFVEGHADLVAALLHTSDDEQFWTFGDGPSPVGFWARRQAHETAMHAVDAQLAVAAPDEVAPLPTWFAVDGIDEFLDVFVRRPGAMARSDPARTLAVAPIDDPARWLITIGPESVTAQRTDGDAPADATLTGTAHDLYCALWNRSPIDRVDVDGDASVLALWAEGVKII